jgi:hypothetical protein
LVTHDTHTPNRQEYGKRLPKVMVHPLLLDFLADDEISIAQNIEPL